MAQVEKYDYRPHILGGPGGETFVRFKGSKISCTSKADAGHLIEILSGDLFKDQRVVPAPSQFTHLFEETIPEYVMSFIVEVSDE